MIDKKIEKLEQTIATLRQALHTTATNAAALLNEKAAWENDARQAQDNTTYYRGLVIHIGQLFREAAHTQDDGGRSENILCAKVPGLVERVVEAILFTRQFLDKLERDMEPNDPLYKARHQYHAPLHAKLDAALPREIP